MIFNQGISDVSILLSLSLWLFLGDWPKKNQRKGFLSLNCDLQKKWVRINNASITIWIQTNTYGSLKMYLSCLRLLHVPLCVIFCVSIEIASLSPYSNHFPDQVSSKWQAMPEKKIAQNYNCMYILANSHANKQYKYYTKYQNIKK